MKVGSSEDNYSELHLHPVYHSQQIRQDTSLSSALLFDQKGNSALTDFGKCTANIKAEPKLP